MSYLVVGFAGIVGALLRYYVGEAVKFDWVYSFPLGTLMINFIGCLVLGWFSVWATTRPAMPTWLRLGFGTGLVGSFTTFSTFSVDVITLFHQKSDGLALLYISLSLFGGLFLAWVGSRLAGVHTS